MNDQADTLRRLMRQRKDSGSGAGTTLRSSSAPVFAFSSGKGGVGKSFLAASLATLLARDGIRTLLVDADFGLANLDIMLGVQAQANVEQVLEGTASVQEAVVGVEPNLWLLPSSSGIIHARSWEHTHRARLADLFECCPWEMDAILIDTGAGIQENVLSLHHPAYHSTIVLTPEPTSLTDAYGLIKMLRLRSNVVKAGVIVNQVTDGREAVATFQKLRDVTARFSDVELEYLGHCARDEKVSQAVMKRKTLLDLNPGAETPAIACLELLSKRLKSRIGQGLREESAAHGRTLRTLGTSRISGRFKEESAHRAPGNTAGFFRNLLGEVKA